MDVGGAALVLGGLLVSTTALGGRSAPSSRAVVKVGFNAKLKKKIVVDAKGRTLYMYTADTGGKPACAASTPTCPKVWPALTTNGKPIAGKGINASRLRVVRGAGGSRQVSYNRHPLYYFHGGFGTGTGDKKPGDARGQGVFSAWYVLPPKGMPIK
jgi:predicted lipoprotein with Yx(FWY)xxD motif